MLSFRLISWCTGLLALPAAAGAQPLAPQTTWINDHARFVIESIDPDGKLTGTYENFGSNFTCAGQVFPVTGSAVSTVGGFLGSETVAASDEYAARLDELQFDLGEGPCWDAVRSGAAPQRCRDG